VSSTDGLISGYRFGFGGGDGRGGGLPTGDRAETGR